MSPDGVPHRWLALWSELNGRIPDGTDGVRDQSAPCEHFRSEYTAKTNPGEGSCETDGHYLCVECPEIELRSLRCRRGECEKCGDKLQPNPAWHSLESTWCPKCDVEPAT